MTARADTDHDELSSLVEFLVNGDPLAFDMNAVADNPAHTDFLLRDLTSEDAITVQVQFSTGLNEWEDFAGPLVASPDQSGVPTGFTRIRIPHLTGKPRAFVRLQAKIQ